MTVAEFVVKLKMLGDTEVGKRLKKVGNGVIILGKKFLKMIAIVSGLVFIFRKLTRGFSESAASIYEFTETSSVSAKVLQKWQHAGRKANLTSSEILENFQALDESLTGQRTGLGGAIRGMPFLLRSVDFDVKKMGDAVYVMGKLQEALSKTFKSENVDKSLVTNLAKTFGLSTKMIVALKESAFTPEHFKGARIYTRDQLKNLRRINSKWSEMGDAIGKAFGKLVNFWAPQVLKILKSMSDFLEHIIGLTTKLSKSMLNLNSEKVKSMSDDIMSTVNKDSRNIVDWFVTKGIKKDDEKFRKGMVNVIQNFNFSGGVEDPRNRNKYRKEMSEGLDKALRQSPSFNRGK